MIKRRPVRRIISQLRGPFSCLFRKGAKGAVLLAATWFLNGGLNGSASMVAMVALVVLATIVDRRPYRFIVSFLLPLVSLLFLIEYFAPSLVSPYDGRGARFIDLYLTFNVIALVIVQIIAMNLQAYREERTHGAEINQRLKDNLDKLHCANTDLEKALAEVNRLSGWLPICSSCHKIRNDEGYWARIETYIQAHSEATFSNSLCPDCGQQLYPDIFPAGEVQNGRD